MNTGRLELPSLPVSVRIAAWRRAMILASPATLGPGGRALDSSPVASGLSPERLSLSAELADAVVTNGADEAASTTRKPAIATARSALR